MHKAIYTIIAWAFMNEKSLTYVPLELWRVSTHPDLAEEGAREIHADLVAFVTVCVRVHLLWAHIKLTSRSDLPCVERLLDRNFREVCICRPSSIALACRPQEVYG